MVYCVGLPASGKTTWALAQCANNPNIVRVNKDDIRASLALGGWVWSREREKDVITKRDALISEALRAGHDVIVDDTNFAHKHQSRIKEIAQLCNATCEPNFFVIDIDEAVRRDALRPSYAAVGEKVIRQMALTYLPPPIVDYAVTVGLPWAIVCDIDGTAALIGNRSPYDASQADVLDRVNEPVHWLLRTVCNAWTPIIYLSGRSSEYRRQTLQFLDKHDFPAGELHMRAEGDKRKDFIVKGELFDAHVRGKFNVRFMLDDRDQVVKYWRSLGLTCLQVAEGNF